MLPRTVVPLGDKRVELARVRDRFLLTVDLVPNDIEEVVSKRVLDKNEPGYHAVRTIYDRYQNQLRANVTLDSPTRGGSRRRPAHPAKSKWNRNRSTLEFELRSVEQFATKTAARARVPAWIHDYNHNRRHSACQMMSPADYERALTARETA
jgi:transposase InsO family protein